MLVAVLNASHKHILFKMELLFARVKFQEVLASHCVYGHFPTGGDKDPSGDEIDDRFGHGFGINAA